MCNETIFQQGQANKKAEPAVSSSFGNSAIFLQKTRRFPPSSHEGFGFVG
jgi:hypothetical protein